MRYVYTRYVITYSIRIVFNLGINKINFAQFVEYLLNLNFYNKILKYSFSTESLQLAVTNKLQNKNLISKTNVNFSEKLERMMHVCK